MNLAGRRSLFFRALGMAGRAEVFRLMPAYLHAAQVTR
jgi:hypothetical protein